MPSILFGLPADLSVLILLEWMAGLKSLVALDNAAAPSVRKEYLGLFAHSAFELALGFEVTKCIDWLNQRSIKLGSLEIHASQLEEVATISPHLLKTVSELGVTSLFDGDDDDDDDDDDEMTEYGPLRAMLKLLPELTSVDFSTLHPPDGDYLVMLAESGLPLKHIYLDCHMKTCKGVDRLLRVHGDALETFHLGKERKANAATLKLIASTCRKAKLLDFTCGDIKTSDFAAALCSDLLPCLEDLTVTNRGKHALNDDLAVGIFQHHRILTAFASEDSPISVVACAAGIALCPNVITLDVGQVYYVVTTIEANALNVKRKYVELRLNQHDDIAHDSRLLITNVLNIARTCQLPVWNLTFEDVLVDDSDLMGVVTALGKDIRLLNFDLNATDNDDAVMQHISENCPLLEDLSAHNWDCVTDSSLKKLADNCHHLNSIRLHSDNVTKITDVGMSYLLRKVGGRLTSLILNADLAKVTTATLSTIIAVCTNLEALGFGGTLGITTESLKTHLITPNALPKLVKLELDAAGLVRLQGSLTKCVGIDARWMPMLQVMNSE